MKLLRAITPILLLALVPAWVASSSVQEEEVSLHDIEAMAVKDNSVAISNTESADELTTEVRRSFAFDCDRLNYFMT